MSKRSEDAAMKAIVRDEAGIITDECMRQMEDSLPIELFVNNEREPCWVANTKAELAHYFDGALPYVLTTKYRKK